MSASIAAIGGGVQPFQPSSVNFLPPFDFAGSSLVANCALQAQQKYQRNSGGNSLHISNEYLLRGLPINQPYHDSTQRHQGALFCRSGTWLEIVDQKTAEFDAHRTQMSHPDYVRGTRKENSRFTILEFLSVAFGLVSIRGLESQLYLCMDKKGRLYGAPTENYTSECVFMEEMLENYYNLYSSCAYGKSTKPWYVALRRTGRPRKGRNARKKQKSSHFLVIHFDDPAKPPKSGPHKNLLYEKAENRKSDNWLKKFIPDWSPPTETPQPSRILSHPQLTLSEILSNSLSSKWPARQMYEQFKRKQLKKLERMVAQPKPLPPKHNTYQTFATSNEVYDSNSMSVTSEEIRVFRQERKRSRRLIREEKRRERRRLQLNRLQQLKKPLHFEALRPQLEALRMQTQNRVPKR